ncbi:MAG: hypothetical protein Q7T50_01265 [Candidatus Magasanikbacteria bacterium]|nr:hypothetical protein [Candidatus Magasanikbacteria bacterium]
MKKNLQKPLILTSIVFVGLIIIFGIIYGNNLKTTKINGQTQQVEQNKLTLQTSGYDYTVGDIVQIKTGQPTLGDVVVYDSSKNKSTCLGLGSKMALGKIVGLPQETFSFQSAILKIRTETIKLDRDYSGQKAVFGNQKYENLIAKNITLENEEFLTDKWVGQECFAGELDTSGSSISYNRFTVNQEAIKGIIVKKIGHDKNAEDEFKSRTY